MDTVTTHDAPVIGVVGNSGGELRASAFATGEKQIVEGPDLTSSDQTSCCFLNHLRGLPQPSPCSDGDEGNDPKKNSYRGGFGNCRR